MAISLEMEGEAAGMNGRQRPGKGEKDQGGILRDTSMPRAKSRESHEGNRLIISVEVERRARGVGCRGGGLQGAGAGPRPALLRSQPGTERLPPGLQRQSLATRA